MTYEAKVKSVYILDVPMGKGNNLTIDFKDFSVTNVTAQASVIKQRKGKSYNFFIMYGFCSLLFF